MYPEIINVDAKSKTFSLRGGTLLQAYENTLLDADSNEFTNNFESLESFFKDLPTNITFRNILKGENVASAENKDNAWHLNTARESALDRIGYNRFKSLITFESKPSFSLKSLGAGHNIFEKVNRGRFPAALRQIQSIPELSAFCLKKEALKLESYGLSSPSHCFGILKLVKLTQFDISLKRLIECREFLPTPFEISFTVRKLPKSEARLILSHKSKQEENSANQTSFTKYQEHQGALQDLEISGADLFRVELHVLLKAQSESEIREKIREAQDLLSPAGDFYLETFGCPKAFRAHQLGGGQHSYQYEKDQNLGFYLPCILRARTLGVDQSLSKFQYHRSSGALEELNIFGINRSSASTLIIGRTGLGKSVFTTHLLDSLSFDPNCHVILVDVKGSHKNVIRRLKGYTADIKLDNIAGFDPFLLAKASDSRVAVEVLKNFISQLCKDSPEEVFKVSEFAKIEKSLLRYLDSTEDPSLRDYLKSLQKDFPRLDQIQRWGPFGIYKSIFSQSRRLFGRHFYCNFGEIHTASNPEVSSAIMAALMALFNFQLMHKSPEEKFVFIADETPFFIKTCFDSFKLMMKNVRKLGGALILTAQDSTDLINQGDMSLLNNAANKILFSVDGLEKEFQARLALSDPELEEVKALKGIKDQFSQFFVKNEESSHVGNLILSHEELALSRPDRLHIEPGFQARVGEA